MEKNYILGFLSVRKQVHNMTLTDLIKEYRERLEINPNDTSCLLFALQIPSICSRIEFPQTAENTGTLYRTNGTVRDKNMYKRWLQKHCSGFVDIYNQTMLFDDFCENLYKLRCQMTHEGVVMTNESKFYFIDGDSAMCIGDIVFLPIKRLCEDMFDIVDITMSNPQVDIKVTPVDEAVLSTEIYDKISNDIYKTYRSFWDNYSADDNMLNCIYDHIIFDKQDMKNKIDDFFNNNPDDVFEIWDFGYKYGHIIDVQEKFIVRKFDKSKSIICRDLNTDTDVLRLTKQQYERMLQVVSEFEDYRKQHPFDITRYIKE